MEEPTVVVGRIVKPHGIRGELVVENRSDNPSRWDVGSVLFLGDGRTVTVAASRPHSGRLLVSFAEVIDHVLGAIRSEPVRDLATVIAADRSARAAARQLLG